MTNRTPSPSTEELVARLRSYEISLRQEAADYREDGFNGSADMREMRADDIRQAADLIERLPDVERIAKIIFDYQKEMGLAAEDAAADAYGIAERITGQQPLSDPRQDEVGVTQADRERAADAARSLEIEHWAADGGYFAELLVQAFAAHRIASMGPVRQEKCAACNGSGSVRDNIDPLLDYPEQRDCPDCTPAGPDQVDRTDPVRQVAMELREALERVIEAAERALGDHIAPHDCFATGPCTGNPIADLIACPGCVQQNEIADARSALASADAVMGEGENNPEKINSASTPEGDRP